MSIYDKASLVLIPSGTKTSKVYSQKPTNGDGDFTFSRSTAATRVNASGNIEKETQNLITYSNDFSQTAWLKYLLSLTSGQSGYDGTSDAWLIEKSGAYGNVYRNISNSGVYAWSVYAKAGSFDFLALRFRNTSNNYRTAYFDLSNGTLGSVDSNIIKHTIQDVGSGWYRCQIAFNDSAINQVMIYPSDANNGINNSGTGNIYIQDAQLEQGLVARDYIETTTTAIYGGITDNVPRLDYTDSSCPALLLEPQRTNVVTQSEYHSDSTYANNNVSVSDNQAVSPEGVQNAAKIVLDSGTNSINGGHYFTYTSTPSEKYTISVFAKAAGYRYFTFTYGSTSAAGAHFDLQEGVKLGDITNAQYTNTSASIEDYGNGWYRLIVSTTDTSTAGRFLSMRPSPSASVPANNNYPSTGDGTSGAYIYGFQIEVAASYATSYIPTYGSGAVTRNADSCDTSNVEDLIGQTEGTIFYQGLVEKATGNDGHAIAFTQDANGNGSSRFLLYRSNATGNMKVYFQNASGVAFGQATLPIPTSSNDKYAIAYSTNDLAIYVNGVLEHTQSVGVIPTTKFVNINRWSGNLKHKNECRNVLLFKTRLSNEELATLTTI